MNLEINNDVLTKKYQNSHNFHQQNQTISYYSEDMSKNFNSEPFSTNFNTTSLIQYGQVNNQTMMGNNKYYSDMNNNMLCTASNHNGIENIQENIYPIDSNMYQYNSSYLNGNIGSMENYCYFNTANMQDNSTLNNSQFNDYSYNNQVFSYNN